MQHHRRFAQGLLGAALVGCASTGGYTTTESGGDVALNHNGVMVSNNAVELRQAMRKLWSDHVVWTRQYIVAAVDGHPSASVTATRLLKNQDDIGNAIAPYYGGAAGTKLAQLLKDHITIAVDLVAAAKAGDNAKLTDADKRWHDNARDIATFLSGANPNWSRDVLLSMLNDHLRLTTDEAKARLEKRWTDEIDTFDKIYDQAMMMADALTDGIIKQFPNKV
jgi:hypothetical protein